MLNYMVMYGLLMGGWLLIYHHGRVVVPGHESNFIRGLGKGILRAWVIALVVLFGMNDLPGPGYALWWETYSSEHSTILWFLVIFPITAVLWLIKSITFEVLRAPGGYHWWGDNMPSLHTLNMWVPTLWYGVFWGWMLLNPGLPFYTCFVRGFVLRVPVSSLFPMG